MYESIERASPWIDAGRASVERGDNGLHARPLNVPNTGPRQYNLSLVGGAPSNFTRNAISVDSSSRLIVPGDIEFDKPVLPVAVSPGVPHSGPDMRGNKTNSTAVSGIAFSKVSPTILNLRPAGRSVSSRFTLISTKNNAVTPSSAIAATCISWPFKNWVNRMKNDRKMTTKMSRRARISSSFSAISNNRKVTPACCPTTVLYCR